jgi:hypothetical protein
VYVEYNDEPSLKWLKRLSDSLWIFPIISAEKTLSKEGLLSRN